MPIVSTDVMFHMFNKCIPYYLLIIQSAFSFGCRNVNNLLEASGLGLVLRLIPLGTLSHYYYAHIITPC